mmetsp:Transcript_10471/g.21091  ORF Transcript_10471/g.21091 Transcript_10471/m.21091 type:complete len:346 (+) Transcript_10471:1564-2601(+)
MRELKTNENFEAGKCSDAVSAAYGASAQRNFTEACCRLNGSLFANKAADASSRSCIEKKLVLCSLTRESSVRKEKAASCSFRYSPSSPEGSAAVVCKSISIFSSFSSSASASSSSMTVSVSLLLSSGSHPRWIQSTAYETQRMHSSADATANLPCSVSAHRVDKISRHAVSTATLILPFPGELANTFITDICPSTCSIMEGSSLHASCMASIADSSPSVATRLSAWSPLFLHKSGNASLFDASAQSNRTSGASVMVLWASSSSESVLSSSPWLRFINFARTMSDIFFPSVDATANASADERWSLKSPPSTSAEVLFFGGTENTAMRLRRQRRGTSISTKSSSSKE